MIRFCHERQDLRWRGGVLTALACTGLRISELASLCWSDIEGQNNLIRLTDESTRGRRRKDQPARQTKSGRSRSFTMHADLRRLLDGMARSGDGRIFHGRKAGRLK